MTTTDFIGFTGVFILLLAFTLSITGIIESSGLAYLWLNFFGALLACIASIMLMYWPFILLEGLWSAVSLGTIIKVNRLK